MKKIIITLTAVVMTIAVFGQTESIVKCSIWKPKSYCQLPDSISYFKGLNFSNASMVGISCRQLDTMHNCVGVRVTFQDKNVSSLDMKSHYENISLVINNGKQTIHPIAFLENPKSNYNGLPEYMDNTSTADKYNIALEPRKRYDLFIIFSSASIGDKLIIENFLETKITE